MKPEIINNKKLEELKKQKLVEVRDLFSSQKMELKEYEVLSEFASLGIDTKPNFELVYLPWKNVVYKMLDEKHFYFLRTNRNRHLIEPHEQTVLKGKSIAIAGASVGSNIAIALWRSGIGSSFMLSDFDTVSTTNLNRVSFPFYEVGEPKIDALTRILYEIDPYAKVKEYNELDDANIDEFVSNADLVFDEIDNLKVKFQLRIAAKKFKKPLLMVTNLGDGVLLNIERYDLDVEPMFFNKFSEQEAKQIIKDIDGGADIQQVAVKIVGMENVPERAIASIKEIGRSVLGRPQLASTVFASGGIATVYSRKILLSEEVASGEQKIHLHQD